MYYVAGRLFVVCCVLFLVGLGDGNRRFINEKSRYTEYSRFFRGI